MIETESLFDVLLESPGLHARTTKLYGFLETAWGAWMAASPFADAAPRAVPFAPFGALTLPYKSMGAIDSLKLFGLDEMIIFAFYWANRARYRKTVDIGANLGLHSILMARAGFSVTAFEPDPVHFDLLNRNLGLNGITTVTPVQAAVSDADGQMEFVRVLGNTTGSHLAGAKDSYGVLEKFPVAVRAVTEALAGAEFAKIDAEGHEVVILKAIPFARWATLDAMIEVGTAENARALHDHFAGSPVRLYAQKRGWQPCGSVEDLPTSHREGSLFLSTKSEMPWR